MAENRKFKVAPNIIYSLIKAQAGTLAKGVGECVMNSIDAGASKVSVICDHQKVIITDDGRGFQTREELEQCFEVFGFEHEEGARTFGQFGIGRAQLWNFCSTIWRTNVFQMDVDIKNRGLDYELVDNLEQYSGLSIEGNFYEEISGTDLISFERELRELCQYVSIDVTVNGKRISKDVTQEKWTHETDDAYIKIREGGDLVVYNLGFLVRKYPSYTVGCGGVVVTKPGIRLALNMARNDILTSECKVWKRIKPYLQKTVNSTRKASKRLTDAQRENIVHLFLAGEADTKTLRIAKLITDIMGKHYTIGEIVVKLCHGYPVSVAEPGIMLAERIHNTNRGFILHTATLGRFGVDSVAQFMEQLKQCIRSYDCYKFYSFTKICSFEKYTDICPELSATHLPIPKKEWTKEEAVIIDTLNTASFYISNFFLTILKIPCRKRAVELGVSDGAMAWTDGANRITYDRNVLTAANKGLAGWQSLIYIMAHEYLHDSADTEDHGHDQVFYHNFHNIVTQHMLKYRYDILQKVYEYYINMRRSKDLPITKTAVKSLDLAGGQLENVI